MADSRCSNAFDLNVAEIAARQHGLATREQLQAAGLGDGAIALRVRNGRLHRVHQGVYAVGHARLTTESRLMAAVLSAGPGAVLSHRAAALLWGLIPQIGAAVDVTAPRKLKSRRGLRFHLTAGLRRDEVTRNAGIPVTGPARTLLDPASTRTDDRVLRRAVREALVQRRVDSEALRAQTDRAFGRRGAARLAAMLATGSHATRSELEDRTLELLTAGGLPAPLVNAPIRVGSHRYEADFLFADRRLVIEADGARFHDTPLARRDDRERQAALEAAGYRVMRVTWEQVTRSTAQTARRLRRAYADTPRSESVMLVDSDPK